MTILTIRTDKPEAEIGLYKGQKQLSYIVWPAHRQLAESIHAKIKEILNQTGTSLEDLGGIVCFKGPGSFTGLRIGLTVANALAYSCSIPIVARADPRWLEKGLQDIIAGQNDSTALPEYGSPPKVTKPRE